jgi:hypothetical protein
MEYLNTSQMDFIIVSSIGILVFLIYNGIFYIHQKRKKSNLRKEALRVIK